MAKGSADLGGSAVPEPELFGERACSVSLLNAKRAILSVGTGKTLTASTRTDP